MFWPSSVERPRVLPDTGVESVGEGSAEIEGGANAIGLHRVRGGDGCIAGGGFKAGEDGGRVMKDAEAGAEDGLGIELVGDTGGAGRSWCAGRFGSGG